MLLFHAQARRTPPISRLSANPFRGSEMSHLRTQNTDSMGLLHAQPGGPPFPLPGFRPHTDSRPGDPTPDSTVDEQRGERRRNPGFPSSSPSDHRSRSGRQRSPSPRYPGPQRFRPGENRSLNAFSSPESPFVEATGRRRRRTHPALFGAKEPFRLYPSLGSNSSTSRTQDRTMTRPWCVGSSRLPTSHIS